PHQCVRVIAMAGPEIVFVHAMLRAAPVERVLRAERERSPIIGVHRCPDDVSPIRCACITNVSNMCRPDVAARNEARPRGTALKVLCRPLPRTPQAIVALRRNAATSVKRRQGGYPEHGYLPSTPRSG